MSDDPCECCNDCCKACGECCTVENCAGCANCCGQLIALATCYVIAEDACARICGIGKPRDEKTVANAQIIRDGQMPTLSKVGEISVVSATVPVCMGIERVV